MILGGIGKREIAETFEKRKGKQKTNVNKFKPQSTDDDITHITQKETVIREERAVRKENITSAKPKDKHE